MSYDNRGKVSLWKNESDNAKAPAMKGNFVAHRDIREGEEIDIALWKNNSDNPRAPIVTGNIQDKREQREPGSDDGPIPF
jgi:hypothetical protein